MHDPMTNRHFRLVLQICGTILLAISLICIAGWAFGNQVLNRFSPQYVPMALDTAWVFVIFGVIFLTYSSRIVINVPLGIRYTLTGIIGVYGLLKTIEFPLGKDLTFTAILFPAKEYLGPYVIGRMSPVTGALFFVSAIATVSLLIGTRRQRLLAGWVGIIVSCIGFLATYAYAFGAPFLYGDGIQPLAAPTAAAFCVLGVGLVAAAGPGAVLKPFVGATTKSRTLRLLVPLVVLTCFAQEILHHFVTVDGEIPRVLVILLVPLTAALTAILAGERLVRYLARRLSESENRLTESEEKFREFFYNAQVGMFRTVIDGSRLLEANDKFLEILGRTRSEAADIPPTTYWADLSERDELIRRLRTEGVVSNFECRLLRKDGDIRNCIVSARIYLPQKIAEGSVLDITERKRSEGVLRRQNEYLTALQKTTLDLLAEHDLDRLLAGILTRAGELVETTTGWLDIVEPGMDHMTPKIALGALTTESRRFAVQKGEGISGRVWETGQPMVVEDYDAWPGRIPDHGQNLIRSILAVPLFSHSEVIGVLGLAYERDVIRSFDDADINVIAQLSRMAGLAIENARLFTAARQELAERLQAEAELRESESRLRLLFDNLTIGVYRTTPRGEILAANPALVRMLGYESFQELAQRNLETSGYAPNYSRHEFKQRLEQSGEIVGLESAWTRADGSIIFVRENARAMRGDDGTILSFEGTAEDITDFKRADESRRRLQKAVETSADVIFMTDINGTFTYVNPAFTRLYGYTADETVARATPRILKSGLIDDATYAEFWRLLLKKRTYRAELVNQRKDGTQVAVEASVNPVLNGHGDIEGFLAVQQDLSERKRAEEEREKLERQLRQAQKLETIGTLAGGVAHDFNNILTPILVYSEMAAKHLGSEHPTRTDLEHVIAGANRAKDLVKQILTFSRQSENEKVLIELSPIIKEALKLLRASLPSTIAIEDHIQTGCGEVLADPSQIHQVLMNLCTNAYHAMRERGGVLKVSVESCQVGSTTAMGIPALSAGEYIRITVSDTGCGMDTHTLERIFEPFYTTKKVGEGTGLGLSVVHGIVRSHDGAITVQSEVGIGTAFDVYLPRLQSSREKDVRQEMPLVGGSERILIVDDEPEVAEVLKDVLEELFGYSVTVRTNSLDALAFLRRQPNRFDLVIADLTMPHLTGDQLACEIGIIRKDLPVILMTGFSEEFNDERCRQLGMAGFLLKPPLSSELARKVRHVLDSVHT